MALYPMTSPVALIRRAKVTDVSTLVDLNGSAYPDLIEEGVVFSEEQLRAHVERFARGQLVAEIDGWESSSDELTCLREARERVPGLKIVVLASGDDPRRIDAAFAAGAVAFVIKTAQPEDLSAAVRQAFEHSIYFAGTTPAPQPAATVHSIDEASVLTRRELEILQLVAEGKSNAQVGRTLWVTEQTVKFHLSNVYRKLDVANRTEASRWAQMRNLLPATRETPEAAAGGR